MTENDASSTVLLIHGVSASARTWDPVVPYLQRDHRVVAIDLRGHGHSGWAGWEPDGYRTSKFTADIRRVIDELGIERAHLVGHSLGARIGIVFAAEHPTRLESLSLSDTLPEVPTAGLIWARDMLARRTSARGFRSIDEFAEHLREEAPGWTAGQYEHFALATLRRNWVGKYAPVADPQLFWITTGSASKRDNDHFRKAAGRIKCPVLVMWGRHSEMVDAEIVDKFCQAAPQAEVVQFDSGHYIMRERPREWVKSLRDFLCRTATRSGAASAEYGGGQHG